MKQKPYIILLAVFLVIAIAAAALLFTRMSALEQTSKATIQLYEQNLTAVSSENARLQAQLSTKGEEYEALGDNLSETSTQLARTTQQYNGLITRYRNLTNDLQSYEASIQENLNWYKENSRFGDSKAEETAKFHLVNDCVKIEKGLCQIKTACFWLTNQERLEVFYTPDYISAGEDDRIFSPLEMLESKEGDCEDYSVLVRAEMEYLKDYCETRGASEVSLESWYYTEHTTDRYFPSFEKTWIIESAQGYTLDEGYTEPSIVCGYIYDEDEELINGHCVMGLTTKPINEEADIELLKDAPIIEPQDGSMYGYVDGEYIVLAEPGVNEKPSNIEYEQMIISTIITDNDLYQYSFEKEEWLSYGKFEDKINTLSKTINEELKTLE